jgi:hypothetical protein
MQCLIGVLEKILHVALLCPTITIDEQGIDTMLGETPIEKRYVDGRTSTG